MVELSVKEIENQMRVVEGCYDLVSEFIPRADRLKVVEIAVHTLLVERLITQIDQVGGKITIGVYDSGDVVAYAVRNAVSDSWVGEIQSRLGDTAKAINELTASV